MFTSFEDPDLASRARNLAGAPAGAFLLAQVYFTLYPLLTTVPRWLFEAVRVVLLLGTVIGLAGVLYLCAQGLRDRRPWSSRAALWLALGLAGAGACGYLLYGMSVPSL
jgi:drug/metabolite transporter (DMT)-like permease